MSDPPKPIEEDLEAPAGDYQEIGQELEDALDMLGEPSDFQIYYSDLVQVLEKPPQQGPEAATLVLDPSAAAPGAVVATGTPSAAAAAVEEMLMRVRGVEMQLGLLPAAPAVGSTQAVPFVLGTEEAPMHDPQLELDDAEVGEEQSMLDLVAPGAATLVVQQRDVAPSEESPMHGPPQTTDGAEVEVDLRMLDPAAPAVVKAEMLERQMMLDSESAVATQTVLQHDIPAVVRGLYSETTVKHLINENRWVDLQAYLLSYIPQDGKDLTLEHAHLFLCCRKSHLLNMLNAKSDPQEVESYFNTSILPLGAATSKYVNSGHLNNQIQAIQKCLCEGKSITNFGSQDCIKDYMDFHFPDQTRFKQGRSVALHFMSKIEGQTSKGRGTILARCKLCQNRLPVQNSARKMVATHFGDEKCPSITQFAKELYSSKILGVQVELKMNKSDEKRLAAAAAAAQNGARKRQRVVDTTAANLAWTQEGGYLLNDINNSIDDVSSSICDLCLMTNTVKNRTLSALKKMKHSIALLVAQTAANAMAGVTVPLSPSNVITDVDGAGPSVSQSADVPLQPLLVPVNGNNFSASHREETTDIVKDSLEEDQEH